MRSKTCTVIAVLSMVGALAVLSGCVSSATPQSAPAGAHQSTATASGVAQETPVPVSAAALAALPEASYGAVIAGLVAYTSVIVPSTATSSYTLNADAPLYGTDQVTAVARLSKLNFMHQATVVVPVQTGGVWSLILTPARQQLPSQHSAHAAAQSAAWVPTSYLVKAQTLTQHLIVSVSKQNVEIVNSDGTTAAAFPAGVGTSHTPTPTNVIGYLQARYLDPKQGQKIYPIQLTSLHSAAADEPYGGTDGGLIGVHYNPVATGDVSHGCVRLSQAAIAAVNVLPLGTLIEILP